MHERTAKLLTQRSKQSSLQSAQITTQELTNLGLLVSIFGEETQALIGRQCSGLQLSLQSQAVMYVQAFHEENRIKLSTILEKEPWKRSKLDNRLAYAKMGAIPSLKALFQEEAAAENGRSRSNGDKSGAAEDTDDSGSGKGCGSIEADNNKSVGQFVVSAECYSVVESIPTFLKVIEGVQCSFGPLLFSP
jgi:hypothetical protein